MTDYKHWKNIPEDQDCCFISTAIEEFIPLLAEPENVNLVLSTIDFYRAQYQFLLYAYVIMPDHLHLLLKLNGTVALPKLIGDFKRYTAKQMLQRCKEQGRNDLLSVFAERGSVDGEKYSVWQRSFRSVPISDHGDWLVKANYIHNNPVRRGLVENAELWPYSSAVDYVGGSGIIAVDKLEF